MAVFGSQTTEFLLVQLSVSPGILDQTAPFRSRTVSVLKENKICNDFIGELVADKKL